MANFVEMKLDKLINKWKKYKPRILKIRVALLRTVHDLEAMLYIIITEYFLLMSIRAILERLIVLFYTYNKQKYA